MDRVLALQGLALPQDEADQAAAEAGGSVASICNVCSGRSTASCCVPRDYVL